MPTTARVTILLAMLVMLLTRIAGLFDRAGSRRRRPRSAAGSGSVRVPDRPLERARRAQGQPIAAVPRLDRDSHVGMGLRRRQTGGDDRFDPGRESPQPGHAPLRAGQQAVLARRQGTWRAAKAVRFTGTLDSSGKLLSLERTEKGTTQRLTLRANSNYIRYTMVLDRKEPGAALFQPLVEIGLTKEGESFAAGSAAVEQPKCIVTGGAATLTVSYQGQSLSDLLHRLPRRVQREPREIPQEARL